MWEQKGAHESRGGARNTTPFASSIHKMDGGDDGVHAVASHLVQAWDVAARDERDLVVACEAGDLERVQTLGATLCVEGTKTWQEPAMLAASRHGHLGLLQWLAGACPMVLQQPPELFGCVSAKDFLPRLACEAAANGHVHVLEWLEVSGSAGELFSVRSQGLAIVAIAACRGGQRAVMEWLNAKGLHAKWAVDFLVAAVQSRSHDMTDWVLERFGTHLDEARQRTVLATACGVGMDMVARVAEQWPDMVSNLQKEHQTARDAKRDTFTHSGQPLLAALKSGDLEVVTWVWAMICPMYGTMHDNPHRELLDVSFRGVSDDIVRFLVCDVWDVLHDPEAFVCAVTMVRCLVTSGRLGLLQWVHEWNAKDCPLGVDLFRGKLCEEDDGSGSDDDVAPKKPRVVPVMVAYLEQGVVWGSVDCLQWLLSTYPDDVEEAKSYLKAKRDKSIAVPLYPDDDVEEVQGESITFEQYPPYASHDLALRYLQWAHGRNPAAFTPAVVQGALRSALWQHNLPAADWLVSLGVLKGPSFDACVVGAVVKSPYFRTSTLRWSLVNAGQAVVDGWLKTCLPAPRQPFTPMLDAASAGGQWCERSVDGLLIRLVAPGLGATCFVHRAAYEMARVCVTDAVSLRPSEEGFAGFDAAEWISANLEVSGVQEAELVGGGRLVLFGSSRRELLAQRRAVACVVVATCKELDLLDRVRGLEHHPGARDVAECGAMDKLDKPTEAEQAAANALALRWYQSVAVHVRSSALPHAVITTGLEQARADLRRKQMSPPVRSAVRSGSSSTFPHPVLDPVAPYGEFVSAAGKTTVLSKTFLLFVVVDDHDRV